MQTARLRALAHPLRLQMLSLLTGAELSAAEVARELDTTQANASYHLRTLHAAGLLVVASRERVNGGVAKRYRHVWDAELKASDAQDPADQVRHGAEVEAEVRTMAQVVPARFARRRTGTPSFFADADLWVEPQVWDEAMGLVRQAAVLVHERALRPHADGAVRANLSVMAFQLQDVQPEHPQDDDAEDQR